MANAIMPKQLKNRIVISIFLGINFVCGSPGLIGSTNGGGALGGEL